MTNNEKNELCKAIGYNVPISEISKITGISKEELKIFREENEKTIDELSEYYADLAVSKEGE